MNNDSQLPNILSSEVNGHKCWLNIYVPEDCVWFSGHFEQAPILSGVAQIDWVMTLAYQYLQVKEYFIGVDALKFQNIIQPGNEFTLELEYLELSQKLTFSMIGTNKKPISSGRIVLVNKSFAE